MTRLRPAQVSTCTNRWWPVNAEFYSSFYTPSIGHLSNSYSRGTMRLTLPGGDQLTVQYLLH